MPYTADNARRNAWDAYHDWVNKGYGIADKITAKEREIQDLEEQLAELENRIGKEVRSGRRRPAKSFVGAAGSSTADNDTNTGEDNSDAVNNQNGTENTDGMEMQIREPIRMLRTAQRMKAKMQIQMTRTARRMRTKMRIQMIKTA